MKIVVKSIFNSMYILFLALFSCQGQSPEIQKEYVDRVISTLASDDMMGRHMSTPGLEKASNFIATEFESIGLNKLQGLDDYQQNFNIVAVTPETASVQIDGMEIPTEKFFTRSGKEGFNWDENSGVAIKKLGPDDKVRNLMFGMIRGNEDALVLVHESHADMFGRFKSFMSRGIQFMEGEEGADLVFVLTNNTSTDQFSVTVSNNKQNQPLNNVVGTIPGKRAEEIVIFSAHYDHIGIRPAINGDSIANGANDDASGVTAVISLAKYFSEMPQPERTLMFVAFTAEEMGGYGSRFFSRQLDPDKIVAMFNIEMIGKPAVDGPNNAWITGFEKSDFGQILANGVKDMDYKFYADPYPDQNLFYRSDNATLARLGVPAHSISTTPIDVDKDYHQVTDHVETLDLDHMTNTIKAIAAGANTIVSGEATPTRVDPQDVRN